MSWREKIEIHQPVAALTSAPHNPKVCQLHLISIVFRVIVSRWTGGDPFFFILPLDGGVKESCFLLPLPFSDNNKNQGQKLSQQLPFRTGRKLFRFLVLCLLLFKAARLTKSKVYTKSGQVVGLLVAAQMPADKLSPSFSSFYYYYFFLCVYVCVLKTLLHCWTLASNKGEEQQKINTVQPSNSYFDTGQQSPPSRFFHLVK